MPNEIETSLHLYQPPLYQDSGGNWHKDYWNALSNHTGATIDPASVLSVLSFGWVCGDRTLVRQIKRRPWLSRVEKDGNIDLEDIPPHGSTAHSPPKFAKIFLELLEEEALRVCAGRKEIYLLLSGGLDSRIIAGVLAKLYNESKLPCRAICITWGLRDSRDIYYGQKIAEMLGLEWHAIEFGPETVLENIKTTAVDLACMHSPELLHYMTWFRTVSEEALVLVASYGDSIGRAEYGGRRLIELDYMKAKNAFGLLAPDVYRHYQQNSNYYTREPHTLPNMHTVSTKCRVSGCAEDFATH
jgi:hypothetical protein